MDGMDGMDGKTGRNGRMDWTDRTDGTDRTSFHSSISVRNAFEKEAPSLSLYTDLNESREVASLAPRFGHVFYGNIYSKDYSSENWKENARGRRLYSYHQRAGDAPSSRLDRADFHWFSIFDFGRTDGWMVEWCNWTYIQSIFMSFHCLPTNRETVYRDICDIYLEYHGFLWQLVFCLITLFYVIENN